MKDLKELYTPREVEERIDLICRNRVELRARAQKPVTKEELESDPKLAAVVAAFKRLKELSEDVRRGTRDAATGDVLIHRV